MNYDGAQTLEDCSGVRRTGLVEITVKKKKKKLIIKINVKQTSCGSTYRTNTLHT